MEWMSYIFSLEKLLRASPEAYGVGLPTRASILSQLGSPNEEGIYKKEIFLVYGYFRFIFRRLEGGSSVLNRMSYKMPSTGTCGIHFCDWNPPEVTTVDQWIDFCQQRSIGLVDDQRYARIAGYKAFIVREGVSVLFRLNEQESFVFSSFDVHFSVDSTE